MKDDKYIFHLKYAIDKSKLFELVKKVFILKKNNNIKKIKMQLIFNINILLKSLRSVSFLLLQEVSYAHQGYEFLIKNTEKKTVIL